MRELRAAAGFADIDAAGKVHQQKQYGRMQAVCIEQDIADKQESRRQHEPCEDPVMALQEPFRPYGRLRIGGTVL